MENEKQSTAFKNEIRYYTISYNIDVDTGEIIQNTKKTMYWLIIGEGEDKYALNVGKKSYEEVNKLIEKEAEKESKVS